MADSGERYRAQKLSNVLKDANSGLKVLINVRVRLHRSGSLTMSLLSESTENCSGN